MPGILVLCQYGYPFCEQQINMPSLKSSLYLHAMASISFNPHALRCSTKCRGPLRFQ